MAFCCRRGQRVYETHVAIVLEGVICAGAPLWRLEIAAQSVRACSASIFLNARPTRSSSIAVRLGSTRLQLASERLSIADTIIRRQINERPRLVEEAPVVPRKGSTKLCEWKVPKDVRSPSHIFRLLAEYGFREHSSEALDVPVEMHVR